MASSEDIVRALEALKNAGGSVDDLRESLEGFTKQELADAQVAMASLGITTTEVSEALDKQKKSIDDSVESLKARATIAERLAELENDEVKRLKRLQTAQELRVQLLEQQVLQGTANIEQLNKERDALEETTEAMRELSIAQQEALNSAKQLGNTIKQAFAGDFKGVLKGVGDNILKNNKHFKKLNADFSKELRGFKNLGAGTQAAFAASMIGVAASIKLMKEEFKLAMDIENVRREFMKTTGAMKEFSMSVIEAGKATRSFDRDMKNAFEASKELRKGFTDFTMLNKSERGEIQNTTTVLSALGIAGGDVAKGLQLSTKALGETASGAAKTQLELNALARDIGVEPSKMAANFAAAGPQLAKLGRDGVKAFKDLAVASKITGLEVSRLLSITEKFDTFEGAATQAGKLNAALGGNFVNAMELMTATDPVERFEMIRNSILDAGLAFDDMSYYQRKFYADAMGLSDVSELAAVMSGNMDSLNGEIGKTSADYENAAKMARDFQSVQDQLKNALYSLLPVFTPLIEAIGDFAAGFADFVDNYGTEIKVVFGVILTVLGAIGIAAAATLGPIMAVISVIGGLISVITGLRLAMFVDHSSPTLFDGLIEAAKRFAGLSSETKQFGIETDMTSKKVKGMRQSINEAGMERSAAPTQANYESLAKVDSTIKETNYNYAQGSQVVHLNVDGKKMGEAMLGPRVRGAAMGGN
jgi:hypothetical protein